MGGTVVGRLVPTHLDQGSQHELQLHEDTRPELLYPPFFSRREPERIRRTAAELRVVREETERWQTRRLLLLLLGQTERGLLRKHPRLHPPLLLAPVHAGSDSEQRCSEEVGGR